MAQDVNNSDTGWTSSPSKYWSTGYVPTSLDDAVIGSSGSVQVLSDVGTVNSLTIDGLLDVLGGTLRVATDTTVTGNLVFGYTSGPDYNSPFGAGSLTVGGTLTNKGAIDIYSLPNISVTGKFVNAGALVLDGNYDKETSGYTTMTVGNLENTGTISIGATNTLNAGAAAAPSTLDTYFDIRGVLNYGSGDITSIGADGTLDLIGGKIDVTGQSGDNSALKLTSNAGNLDLESIGSLTLAGPFTNSSTFGLDAAGADSDLTITGAATNTGTMTLDGIYYAGGTTFQVDGKLTNSGRVIYGFRDIENASTIALGALDNSGKFRITGSPTAAPVVTVAGDVDNTGSITTANKAVFTVSGDLSNAGTITLDVETMPGAPGVYGPAAQFSVAGTATDSGTLTVNSGSSFRASSLEVASGGTLTLAGGSLTGALDVDSGGTFDITGYNGVTYVPPGPTDTGDLTLVAGAHFGIQVQGSAAGLYSQDEVTGGVSLAGATLDLTLVDEFVPTAGDSFTIISNDGTDAVSGTFAGLAQGATTAIDGYDFTIDYAGGDGNDVVLTADGIACYCRGTSILTADGERAVEDLAIGDRLVTASGSLRPIRWIGRRSYTGRYANANADVLPICFKAGALADAVPRRDLWVSPEHAMFLDGALIPAKRLINGTSILQAISVACVDYLHIELDSHDVILAEGALSETFVDDKSRGMFHNAPDYAARYPEAEPVTARYCAPRVEDGFVLDGVRRRLSARAGLAVGAADLGPLRGTLDVANASGIEGWAQNLSHPEGAVCLDVFVDGQLRHRTLAQRYRDDLRAAGIGSGAHSFSLQWDRPLSADRDYIIEVCRSGDGAPLWCSPRKLEARVAG